MSKKVLIGLAIVIVAIVVIAMAKSCKKPVTVNQEVVNSAVVPANVTAVK